MVWKLLSSIPLTSNQTTALKTLPCSLLLTAPGASLLPKNGRHKSKRNASPLWKPLTSSTNSYSTNQRQFSQTTSLFNPSFRRTSQLLQNVYRKCCFCNTTTLRLSTKEVHPFTLLTRYPELLVKTTAGLPLTLDPTSPSLSDTTWDQLHKAIASCRNMKMLKHYIMHGWPPSKINLPTQLQPFWHFSRWPPPQVNGSYCSGLL